jgi:hypothetical protein
LKRELRSDVPLLFVKIGDERPERKEAVEGFLGKAQGKCTKLDGVSYEKGIHGFDTDQPGEESNSIVTPRACLKRASTTADRQSMPIAICSRHFTIAGQRRAGPLWLASLRSRLASGSDHHDSGRGESGPAAR